MQHQMPEIGWTLAQGGNWRNSTTRSRALVAGQDVTNYTLNNQLTASAAPIVVISLVTVARMLPPG
jgi:hypothetical protein